MKIDWIKKFMPKAILKGVSRMIWKKVFGKFVKGFLVALGIAILTGVMGGLQTFVPEGAVASMVWKALGPTLIGVVLAAINAIKHWNDPKPAE